MIHIEFNVYFQSSSMASDSPAGLMDVNDAMFIYQDDKKYNPLYVTNGYHSNHDDDNSRDKHSIKSSSSLPTISEHDPEKTRINRISQIPCSNSMDLDPIPTTELEVIHVKTKGQRSKKKKGHKKRSDSDDTSQSSLSLVSESRDMELVFPDGSGDKLKENDDSVTLEKEMSRSLESEKGQDCGLSSSSCDNAKQNEHGHSPTVAIACMSDAQTEIVSNSLPEALQYVAMHVHKEMDKLTQSVDDLDTPEVKDNVKTNENINSQSDDCDGNHSNCETKSEAVNKTSVMLQENIQEQSIPKPLEEEISIYDQTMINGGSLMKRTNSSGTFVDLVEKTVSQQSKIPSNGGVEIADEASPTFQTDLSHDVEIRYLKILNYITQMFGIREIDKLF